MFFLLSYLALAEPQLPEEPQVTIIVEAHRDFEVYVAPIVIRNESEDVEAVISDYSVFGYASIYAHNAEISNGTGGFEPLSLNSDGFKLYNEDTISYVWEGCDYKKDAKKCSYQNNHYLIETYITIGNQQLAVEMFMFDPNLQVISKSTVTNTKIIKWIKQQAVNTNTNTMGSLPQSRIAQDKNCTDSSCSTTSGVNQTPGYYQRDVTVDKPLERLPLKWEIPHRLLNRHIQQASLLLWCSVKIKE